MKSTVASRFLLVDRDLHLDHGALVHLVLEARIVQPVDHAPHALGRVVLHVLHVGLDHRQRELRHHLVQLLHALLVGGDLRLHVVDVLQRVARGVSGAVEQPVKRLLAEAAALHQLEIVDIDPFLLDRGRIGRHGARRDPADIGMMAARGDPEQDACLREVEDRRAYRDVGKMRAAVIGRVDDVDVARRDAALVLADHGLDRAIHGAQMHRHVRRIGNQRAVGGKNRAGEIEPLLDVDGIGGVLQRHAHLLRNGHEEIVEYFQHHRIGRGADRALASSGTERSSTRWFFSVIAACQPSSTTMV